MDFISRHSWAVLGAISLLLLVLILVFGLGAAVGASNSYSAFVNTLIPLLSMVGSWLSGIGALAAAIVSLWLANKSSREDVEDCEVDYRWLYGRFVLEAISQGKRPITITGAAVKFSNKFCKLEVDSKGSSPRLPATLHYGQNVEIQLYYEDTFRKLEWFFREYEVTPSSEVYLVVFSTMYTYEELLSAETLKSLIDETSRYSK
ncbi:MULTISPECIES: hypothetical protein [unclassified Pseudomonas]|uniref:hypothetical protein n=1 Tax=unclassified Pseudomonas TaxID=196821 RepID=UPI0024471E26|nr:MULTISPECIES: hypothetical protein [unclassified Pseudomonas]MDG9924477.1 hypothetical protein [Pseudomonas sp. GD04045]MDH0035183.1 hypothetical protein [Pseudomonas sp. GD04019]